MGNLDPAGGGPAGIVLAGMLGGTGGNGEGEAIAMKKKLDELGRQLDGVASGQIVVESLVRKIYQELHLAVGVAGPHTPGSSLQRQDSRTPTLGDRSEARFEFADRKTSRLISGSAIAKDRGKEGSIFDKAKADELGFWPRQELIDIKSNNTVTYGSALRLTTSYDFNWAPRRHEIRPIHPDSWRRAFFDFLSVIVLLYDSLMIPYQFAWHLEFSGSLAVVSWSTSIFWVVDLLLGFVTGYHVRDKVVMDFHKIAKHYLARGFFLNLLVVVADLVGNVLEMVGDASVLGTQKTLIKLTRFLKLNRVWRLSHSLRHGKVAEGWDVLATLLRRRGLDEQFNFISRVCRLVFYIMWVNHLGGCLWHMIGQDGTYFWYIESDWDPQTSNTFEYLLAFYWSASSMIAGGSIMKPTTTFELLMTVFCVVFGFIFSSVLISSLLTTVIEFQEANKEQYEKLKTLRQFLYQHSVDSRLAVPLVQQVHERMGKKKRLAEGDVDALSLLSPMMRFELWYYIYGPSLADNPILCACNAVESGMIKDICFRALNHQSHMPGSRIFEPRVEAVGTYYVYYGDLEYVMLPSSSPGSEPAEQERTEEFSGDPNEDPLLAQTFVKKGAWISQVAIWAHWLHRGWLDARKVCELLTVQAEPFLTVIAGHPELIPLAQTYSKCLLKALEQEPAEGLTDVALGITHAGVVAAMPLDMRITLSRAAMSVLESNQQWSGRLFQQQGMQELEAEINSGDCDLMVDASNEVKRVVTIVALRVCRRSDGAILTQIGKCTKGVMIPGCSPPGTKIKVGEYPFTAVERLLKQKLKEFQGRISIESHSVDEEERPSRKYGVSSTYMRTLYEAKLEDVAEDYMQPLIRSERCITPVASMGGVLTKGLPGRIGRTKSFDPTFQYQAFVFKSEMQKGSGTSFIYSWISREDFDYLSSEAGALQLQKWVGELQMEGETASVELQDRARGARSGGEASQQERARGARSGGEASQQEPLRGAQGGGEANQQDSHGQAANQPRQRELLLGEDPLGNLSANI